MLNINNYHSIFEHLKNILYSALYNVYLYYLTSMVNLMSFECENNLLVRLTFWKHSGSARSINLLQLESFSESPVI